MQTIICSGQNEETSIIADTEGFLEVRDIPCNLSREERLENMLTFLRRSGYAIDIDFLRENLDWYEEDFRDLMSGSNSAETDNFIGNLKEQHLRDINLVLRTRKYYVYALYGGSYRSLRVDRDSLNVMTSDYVNPIFAFIPIWYRDDFDCCIEILHLNEPRLEKENDSLQEIKQGFLRIIKLISNIDKPVVLSLETVSIMSSCKTYDELFNKDEEIRKFLIRSYFTGSSDNIINPSVAEELIGTVLPCNLMPLSKFCDFSIKEMQENFGKRINGNLVTAYCDIVKDIIEPNGLLDTNNTWFKLGLRVECRPYEQEENSIMVNISGLLCPLGLIAKQLGIKECSGIRIFNSGYVANLDELIIDNVDIKRVLIESTRNEKFEHRAVKKVSLDTIRQMEILDDLSLPKIRLLYPELEKDICFILDRVSKNFYMNLEASFVSASDIDVIIDEDGSTRFHIHKFLPWYNDTFNRVTPRAKFVENNKELLIKVGYCYICDRLFHSPSLLGAIRCKKYRLDEIKSFCYDEKRNTLTITW